MELSKSVYYYRPHTTPEEQRFEEELTKRIEEIADDNPGYGQRRIYKELRRDQSKKYVTVNHKRVERIVREQNLQCQQPKAYRVTTNSNHKFPRYPNLIKDIVPERINQIWVADITYIHLLRGFVYLAAILDLFSRKVIGYALSMTLDATFAIEALKMAIERRRPEPGCIHHSDHGVQYACNDYVDVLKEHKLVSSMAKQGNPYENANAESFFKTFKYEEVHLNDYRTIDDVIERVPYFIEQVYNARRLHSSLGYVPPNEFEALQAAVSTGTQPAPVMSFCQL
jgi:transposase InsO family protein